jgi:hypothetical protein
MTDDFTPIDEVEPETQLAKIVQESGLEKSKAQVLLDNFSNYFKLAAEWEVKAKTLVITDVSQKAEMKMAREGRLFLKSKRLEVEKTRKTLKEQSLREGKAIDGIANVLKAVIEPIENYLDEQEKFAEYKEQEKKLALKTARIAALAPYAVDITAFSDLGEMAQETFDSLLMTSKGMYEVKMEAVRKMEADKIAKEEADAKERQRIQLENERLRKEAEEKDRLAKAEKAKADKVLADAKAKADAERRAIEEKNRIEREKQETINRKAKADADEKLRKERAENDRLQAELKAKQDKEAKELKAKQDAEAKAKSAPDKEKLKVLAEHLRNPKLPEMTCAESKEILAQVRVKMLAIAKFIDDNVANK